MALVVTDRALIRAVDLGVVDEEDADIALRRMVDMSAPISHKKGNLRYDEWVFRVDAGRLLDVNEIKCDVCDDRGETLMYEPCEECNCGGLKVDRCKYRHTRMVPCHCTINLDK